MNFQAEIPILLGIERNSELDGGVLVADFVGDGVFQSALGELGVFEHSKQPESADLDFGVGRGFGNLLQFIEERGVAVAC